MFEAFLESTCVLSVWEGERSPTFVQFKSEGLVEFWIRPASIIGMLFDDLILIR